MDQGVSVYVGFTFGVTLNPRPQILISKPGRPSCGELAVVCAQGSLLEAMKLECKNSIAMNAPILR